MQFEHDKHQYYFEKYIRNEMKPDERAIFEQKLQSDTKLKQAFEFYRNNRLKIIEEELKEYQEDLTTIIHPPKKPEKWGWLYLSISVLGLVLIADYFIGLKYRQEIHDKPRKSIIERINIFDDKKEIVNQSDEKLDQPKKEIKNTPAETNLMVANEDSLTTLLNEFKQQLTEFKQENIASNLNEDVLLFDSIFGVLNENLFYQRMHDLTVSTDSVLTDSAIIMLTLKSMLRKPERMLFTEFWKSPVNFKGYRFSGKKIQIYGITPQIPCYFLYDAFQNKHYLINGKLRYELVQDNYFHKFTPELND